MTMADGGRLVLDNFNAKYIDARIDMRTGHVLLKEGNFLGMDPRYIVIDGDEE
jgi:hypothetical protein